MDTVIRKNAITKRMKRAGAVALAATVGTYELFAHCSRGGPRGGRFYRVSLSAIKILSTEPRKIHHVNLPDTCRSNVDRACEYLRLLIAKDCGSDVAEYKLRSFGEPVPRAVPLADSTMGPETNE